MDARNHARLGRNAQDLQPDKAHRPVGGLAGSRKERDCSGEAVKANLHLGYQIRTDVLEVFLRSPLTGEWLPDTPEGRLIATTLGVAMRDVIADRLGIASSEMGFSHRQTATVTPDKAVRSSSCSMKSAGAPASCWPA